MSSQSDYDAYIANLRLRQTIDNALPRARAVQKTIDNLQQSLLNVPQHKGAAMIALLASYEAEMARIFQIPGMAQAFYAYDDEPVG